MNNTNNFTLMKRIDDFKKRYNELLLELDNSSFWILQNLQIQID